MTAAERHLPGDCWLAGLRRRVGPMKRLAPDYLRNDRRKAQSEHLRQMKTFGVLPSSATLLRGSVLPQQPHRTVTASITAAR